MSAVPLHEIRADAEDQLRDAWEKCARLERLPLGILRALYKKHREDPWPGPRKAAGRLSVNVRVNI